MPSKYRRVAKPLSCAECRRLKIKCDLRFPCEHCTKRGLAGICPDAELVNGSRRVKVLSTTEELHRRIEALEQVLESIQPGHPALQESSFPRVISRQTQVATERRRLQLVADHKAEDSDKRGECSTGLSFAPAAGHGDSQGVLPRANLIKGPGSGSTRYYGAANSVYLSRKSIPGMDQVEPSMRQDIFRCVQPTLFRSPTHDLDRVLTECLPPVSTARRLAELFFEVIGCFTPIVNPETWEEQFFCHVYPPDGRPVAARPQQAAVVFFVLAIGSRVDYETPDNETTASSLAAAAQLCLGLDTSHTLHFVRCLILYGHYVMNGRQDPTLGDVCWPLLRMTMGIVEALGLHREDSSWSMDTSERNERRVVFWDCQTHDVMQSVNLGRGQCIASYAIDCPTVDVDGTGFYSQSWELTKILSKINTVQVRVAPSPYAEILSIDKEIADFERSLPPDLSPQASPSPFDLTDPVKKRLALKRNILSMYANEARVTLHRGWFVEAIRISPVEPLETDYRTSYLACLEASRSIAVLVRNVVVLDRRSVRTRWHYYVHLFSACVCLAAAVIHAPRSMMAAAAMAELDAAVKLFRFTQRDGLELIVDRLCRHAEARLAGGQPRAEESEALDLLGARSQTIQPTSFADLDIDMLLQMPAVDGGGQAFPSSSDGGDYAFSLDDLLRPDDRPPMQAVDDPEVRALLSYFGLS